MPRTGLGLCCLPNPHHARLHRFPWGEIFVPRLLPAPAHNPLVGEACKEPALRGGGGRSGSIFHGVFKHFKFSRKVSAGDIVVPRNLEVQKILRIF